MTERDTLLASLARAKAALESLPPEAEVHRIWVRTDSVWFKIDYRTFAAMFPDEQPRAGRGGAMNWYDGERDGVEFSAERLGARRVASAA